LLTVPLKGFDDTTSDDDDGEANEDVPFNDNESIRTVND